MHEMGIRVALGAQGGDVVRLVLGEGFKLVLIGVAIGVALAAALSRLVGSLLYDVTARDPLSMAAAAVLLLSVGLAASLGPAHRASRVDPAMVLREE